MKILITISLFPHFLQNPFFPRSVLFTRWNFARATLQPRTTFYLLPYAFLQQ